MSDVLEAIDGHSNCEHTVHSGVGGGEPGGIGGGFFKNTFFEQRVDGGLGGGGPGEIGGDSQGSLIEVVAAIDADV